MPTAERIDEVLVENDVHIRFGECIFQSLKLRHKAFGIVWRIFPIQSKLDTELGNLYGDANDTNDAEWIGHYE
jgi:hypothetical protein